jgi:hypothetical protein
VRYPFAHRFFTLVFSYRYKSLFPQASYFHIDTEPPGMSPCPPDSCRA